MSSYYRIALPKESLLWGRLLSQTELQASLTQEEIDPLLERMEIIPSIIGENKQGYYCNRCGNEKHDQFAVMKEQRLFGFDQDRHYCLNCLSMGRMLEGQLLYHVASPPTLPIQSSDSLLTWQGRLSPQQAKASSELLDALLQPDQAHMIHAVTGAGKTEIIFQCIDQVLLKGGRVAIVSPRVDVCLELFPRLQEAFASVPMSLLYGGSEEVYHYTPLVISTTHQLYRFKQAFDLVILDEVDAFPFVGDASLDYALHRSLKNSQAKLVYLTATPTPNLTQAVEDGRLGYSLLPARYHRHSLPEPEFVWIGNWQQTIRQGQQRSTLMRQLKPFIDLEGRKLIFMPSIALAEELFAWLSRLESAFNWACVHSKDPDREQKVQALRQGQLKGLITTTILERGVTFENCHVFILGAESPRFQSSTLVQMSGRVGRRPSYPSGCLIYGHYGESKAMQQARAEIKAMNREAKKRGLLDE